jgi:hypothetical protein
MRCRCGHFRDDHAMWNTQTGCSHVVGPGNNDFCECLQYEPKANDLTVHSFCGWGKHYSQADDIDNPIPPDGGFMIRWSCRGVGFGELAIEMKDGKIKVDDEYMGKEFCLAVLRKLLEVDFD